MIRAYGIFEGGGAKGLAHIGALSAAEENHIEFIGYAGSSAGAIVASLLAVGYTPRELFNSADNGPETIFDEDFVDYIGKFRWRLVSLCRTVFDMIGKNRFISSLLYGTALVSMLLGLFFTLNFLWEAAGRSVGRFAVGIGGMMLGGCLLAMLMPSAIFSGDGFESWLNEKLSSKLFPGDPVKIVLFRHIATPLKIIATDLRLREPIVFTKNEEFKNYSVAKAVRSSIAIPGVFAPLVDGTMTLVDGGILSNFPAWVFDRERRESDEILSTIGFRLHSPERINAVSSRETIIQYASSLAQVFFGDNKLQTRGIEDLHLIPIVVTTRTLDFRLARDKKNTLYNEGYVAAQKFFRYDFNGPKNSERIITCLEQLEGWIRDILGDHKVLLRLNVAKPVEPLREELRVLYQVNMDKDADDRLQLPLGSGAIGECWKRGRPIYADMVLAKDNHLTNWKMSKYKQALVRSDLKSLLSIPITESGTIKDVATEDIRAILSIDSNENLSEEFSKANDEESDIALCLSESTKKLARELSW